MPFGIFTQLADRQFALLSDKQLHINITQSQDPSISCRHVTPIPPIQPIIHTEIIYTSFCRQKNPSSYNPQT